MYNITRFILKYFSYGKPVDTDMQQRIRYRERDARIDEVNRFEDWLVEHDPHDFVKYAHTRAAELDALKDDETRR